MKHFVIALVLPAALAAQAPRSARIDSLLATVVPAEGPGAAVLVISNGMIVHQKGYGYADVEKKAAITPRTTFDLASVSKQFTAMAIMILAERGKLSFDDTITKFFPELPAYAKSVTVRHLMTHTSGMPDYMEVFNRRPPGISNRPSSSEVVAMLALIREPLFPAGSKFEYSNSGYVVLGQIAEKAAGEPLPQFMKHEIFDKLGMGSTILSDQIQAPSPNRAISYRPRDGAFVNADFTPLNRIYGDGNVNTSLEDMVKWDYALATNFLVKPGMFAQAIVPMTLTDGTKSQYGFGWRLSSMNGQPVMMHGGSWAGFRSGIVRVPSAQLTVVVLSNFAEVEAAEVAQKIAGLWLDGAPKTLAPGTELRLWTADRALQARRVSVVGTLGDTIVVAPKDSAFQGTLTLRRPLATFSRVEWKEKRSRSAGAGHGARIGALLGFATGAVIMARHIGEGDPDGSPDSGTAYFVAVSAGSSLIGAGTGAVVGAVVPGRHWSCAPSAPCARP